MIGKIIQYEIDNHSDIIPVELLHECFSYSWQHWRHRKEKYIIKHGLIGCYILYNEKSVNIGWRWVHWWTFSKTVKE